MQPAARQSKSLTPSLSVLLMLTLGVSFIAQQIVIVPKAYSAYLFLSGYGMKSWHLWELFTYQFFHSTRSLVWGLLHLSVNLAGLWFLGRAMEAGIGRGRFLRIYLGAVLAGALAQGGVALTGFLLPESCATTADFLVARFGDSVGASVGLCGVLSAFCLWRHKTAPLWIALGIAVLLVIIPTDPSLAHVAHLVGMLAGVAFFKLGEPRS